MTCPAACGNDSPALPGHAFSELPGVVELHDNEDSQMPTVGAPAERDEADRMYTFGKQHPANGTTLRREAWLVRACLRVRHRRHPSHERHGAIRPAGSGRYAGVPQPVPVALEA